MQISTFSVSIVIKKEMFPAKNILFVPNISYRNGNFIVYLKINLIKDAYFVE